MRHAAHQWASSWGVPGRVEDCGNKIEVREARAGRGFVRHEDVRLLGVRRGAVAKRRETDSSEVPMCEADTMQVLQTLGRPMQLSSHFSRTSGRGSEVTH